MPWLRPSVSRYIARFHRRSARVFTPSEPARDDLDALGVTRVEVWGRGVDINAFSPARRSQPLRAAYGIDDVGRVSPRRPTRRGKGRRPDRRGVSSRARDAPGGRGATDHRRRRSRRERAARARRPRRALSRRARPPDDRCRDCTRAPTRSSSRRSPRRWGSSCSRRWRADCRSSRPPAGGVADHLRDDVNGIAVPAARHRRDGDGDRLADARRDAARTARRRRATHRARARLGERARSTRP